MNTSALRIVALVMLPGLASAASFTPLGVYQGSLPSQVTSSGARSVSADGSVVVGWNYAPSTAAREAFHWRSSVGFSGLGDFAGGFVDSFASDVSPDGSVVIGNRQDANGSHAFLWASGTGMIPLYRGTASAISADGSVIVGTDRGVRQATRLDVSTGETAVLGDLPGGGSQSNAYDVSADGAVIVGVGSSSSGLQAFRWTFEVGFLGLGYLQGGTDISEAHGVSADGNVVVGRSRNAANRDEAFRWTPGDGMAGLGTLDGTNSYAYGVSADGNVIVGESGGRAFVWTADDGMQSLFNMLVARNVSGLAGWRLESAYGISADGRFVVGVGTNSVGQAQAFVANIAPIPIPPAVWLFGSALGLMSVMRRRG